MPACRRLLNCPSTRWTWSGVVSGRSLAWRRMLIQADARSELLNHFPTGRLVAHNASFDLGFLNAELERVSLPAISRERLVDTLLLARRKYPTMPTLSA
jgi:hypothetical protein